MYPQTLAIGLLTAANRMTLSIYRLMWSATIWTLLTRSTLRRSSFMILPTTLSSILSLSRLSTPHQCPPRPPMVPDRLTTRRRHLVALTPASPTL